MKLECFHNQDVLNQWTRVTQEGEGQPDRWTQGISLEGKARQISESIYIEAMNVQDGIKPQPKMENMTKNTGWIENSQ